MFSLFSLLYFIYYLYFLYFLLEGFSRPRVLENRDLFSLFSGMLIIKNEENKSVFPLFSLFSWMPRTENEENNINNNNNEKIYFF